MFFRFFLKTANFVKYSVLPRKNHYICYVALLKNNEKSTKIRRKSDANLGWENKHQKNAQKSDLGGFWLPFGRGLGGSGASLGHSWALLGCFLGVQKPTSSKHWSRMGSKRPSGSILEPFWEGLGRFWGGFGPISRWILEHLGAEHENMEDLGTPWAQSLVRTPALVRVASQCAGVLPPA